MNPEGLNPEEEPRAGRGRHAVARTAARLVSDLVNPLFVPTLAFALTGWMIRLSAGEMTRVLGLSLLFYTIIPLGVTWYLFHTGYIRSLDLPDRAKRNRLFLLSILSSLPGSLLLLLLFFGSHPVIGLLAGVFLLNAGFGLLLNRHWKISIHAASIATVGSYFCVLWYRDAVEWSGEAGIASLFTLMVLLPIMSWARYYLDTHTVSELAGGILAGTLLTAVELILLLRLL